jgi:hypothetical protein
MSGKKAQSPKHLYKEPLKDLPYVALENHSARFATHSSSVRAGKLSYFRPDEKDNANIIDKFQQLVLLYNFRLICSILDINTSLFQRG